MEPIYRQFWAVNNVRIKLRNSESATNNAAAAVATSWSTRKPIRQGSAVNTSVASSMIPRLLLMLLLLLLLPSYLASQTLPPMQRAVSESCLRRHQEPKLPLSLVTSSLRKLPARWRIRETLSPYLPFTCSLSDDFRWELILLCD